MDADKPPAEAFSLSLRVDGQVHPFEGIRAEQYVRCVRYDNSPRQPNKLQCFITWRHRQRHRNLVGDACVHNRLDRHLPDFMRFEALQHGINNICPVFKVCVRVCYHIYLLWFSIAHTRRGPHLGRRQRPPHTHRRPPRRQPHGLPYAAYHRLHGRPARQDGLGCARVAERTRD